MTRAPSFHVSDMPIMEQVITRKETHSPQNPAAPSPMRESLTSATASSASATAITGSVGPKVSSVMQRIV